MNKTELLVILEKRFNENTHLHPNHKWSDVLNRINDNNIKTLINMEQTGGEINVVDLYDDSSKIIFVDCSKESPDKRRSVCYDHEALNKRKTNKPNNSAINMANEIGSTILNELEYRKLQSFGDFDLKTSSWILTPKEIRDLGGAVFCDKRYNQTFLYHNGADSYYSSRAFRTKLEI